MKKLILVTNYSMAKLPYLQVIEESCKAGIDGIILRENLKYNEYFHLGKRVKNITDKYQVPLSINNSYSIYEEIGASFHHSKEMSFLKEGILSSHQGVSVHSYNNGKYAQDLGAAYLLVGHIFTTDCKKGLEPRGVEFLAPFEELDIPIYAIGGINKKTIGKIKNTDIAGVAVMSDIMRSTDPYTTVIELKSILGG